MITARKFKSATGRDPEQDDLERCNCRKAGQMFHLCCGWDKARNLPRFETYGRDRLPNRDGEAV